MHLFVVHLKPRSEDGARSQLTVALKHVRERAQRLVADLHTSWHQLGQRLCEKVLKPAHGRASARMRARPASRRRLARVTASTSGLSLCAQAAVRGDRDDRTHLGPRRTASMRDAWPASTVRHRHSCLHDGRLAAVLFSPWRSCRRGRGRRGRTRLAPAPPACAARAPAGRTGRSGRR